MSKKRPRVIRTTEDAIIKTEIELNFKFPNSFRDWLIQTKKFRWFIGRTKQVKLRFVVKTLKIFSKTSNAVILILINEQNKCAE